MAEPFQFSPQIFRNQAEKILMQAIPADDLFSSLEFQLSLMRLSSALESRQPSHSAPDRQLEQLLRQQMYLDRA